MDYEFFYGADKADFDVPALKAAGIYDEALAIKNHRYHKPMRDGQLGCSWSHRMVYEDILAKGCKQALILEDDVILNTAALPAFEQAMQELPASWELLYLDYALHEKKPLLAGIKQGWYHIQRFFGGITYSHQTIQNLYPKPFSSNLQTAGYHDFTDAYAITAAGAAKLLQLQTPISRVADNLLAHACSNKIVNGFVLKQKLFSQHSQGTDGAHSYVNA